MATTRYRVVAVNPQGQVTVQDAAAAVAGARHGAADANAAPHVFQASPNDLGFFQQNVGKDVTATWSADTSPEAKRQSAPSTTSPSQPAEPPPPR